MRHRGLAIAIALLTASTSYAATSRTIEATLPAGDPFTIENLAGTMTVVAGDGADVHVKATVFADTAAIADKVKLDRVRGEGGRATLRVAYPLGGSRTLHYPKHRGTTTVEYGDRRVRVSGSRGVEVWADLEIRVPRSEVDAVFRNLVGGLRADGTAGRITLDAASADIEARRMSGRIIADTGSGEVRAEDLRGSYKCDTGSGGCLLRGFDGDTVELDTGSGGVRASEIRARRLRADTGSGGVRIENADVEEVRADTGSGGVVLELVGSRLRRIVADTGSGGVTLRLPAGTGFELSADQGSGDLDCRIPGAELITQGRDVVGCRNGDRRVVIDVDTGSGDVVVTQSR